MVAPSIPLRDERDLALNDTLSNYSPGFTVAGVVIGNDTGNWLLVNNLYLVPPWTYGWSQPLPGTRSVSVVPVPGPTIVPSTNAGTFVRVILTSDPIPQSNGYTATVSVASIIGSITVGGTVDVSGSNVNAVITNALTIAGVVNIAGAVTVGGTVDVTGSTVNATITNTVTITGTIDIGNILGGTINIGTVTGDVSIVPGVFTLTGQSVKKVAVTGTRVQLHASLTVKVVMIKARATNSGTIYLGTVTVTNDETATGGLQLDPGDLIAFTDTDIGNVYLNGAAGDGVTFLWWV